MAYLFACPARASLPGLCLLVPSEQAFLAQATAIGLRLPHAAEQPSSPTVSRFSRPTQEGCVRLHSALPLLQKYNNSAAAVCNPQAGHANQLRQLFRSLEAWAVGHCQRCLV